MDGKITFDTTINNEGIKKDAVKTQKTVRSQVAKLASEFRKLGMDQSAAMRQAWKEIGHTTKTGARAAGRNIENGLGSSMRRMRNLILSAFSVAAITEFTKSSVKLGSDLAEVQNVVDVTFTTMSHKVDEFAEKAIRTAGLSETAAKQYMGTYGAMAKSFGFTEKQAYNMAESITQLTGDVASFYNLSQDLAYVKMKSIFTGETETLKDLGIVMTQANLDQYALSHGYGQTTAQMTEQCKVLLRQQFVMDRLRAAQGDFVRTQDGWANQTRVLGLQFQQLKATLGQGFINALTPAVQMLNTLMGKLQQLAVVFKQVTAKLFGDAGGGGKGGAAKAMNEAAVSAENLSDGVSSVGGAAAKASKSLAKFDDLNKLQAPDSGGGGGSAGIGGIPELDIPKGNDLKDSIFDEEKIDRIAEKVKTIAGFIPVLAGGLAGLKLGRLLSDLVTANIKADTLKKKIALLGKKLKLTAGVTLAVTGIALETKGIVETIRDKLDFKKLAEIVLGGGMVTGGGALIGSAFGSAIIGAASGGILAGIPGFITGIIDAVKNGFNWMNAILIPAGSTAAGAGIGAIIGSLGGPIGTGIGALIGLVVGAVTDLTIVIVQKWDEISAWLKDTFSDVSKWFGTMWKKISGYASQCWESIKEFFSPAIEWFSQLLGSVKQTFSDIFYDVGVIARGCWEVVKKAWGIASGWFRDNVLSPIERFFSGMWQKVVEKAGQAWDGIKSVFGTVAQFFGDVFSKAWKKIIDVFSVAGEIFVDIKDAIVGAFKKIVNAIIRGINSVVAVPFNGINNALRKLKNAKILGLSPFSGLRTISVPQIPQLAKGAVLPANRPFLSIVGDQKHGTNVEAPLETIQEAVANVMGDMSSGMMAGFEANIAVLREILEAILGIRIGDDVIAQAVSSYNRKMAVVNGGAL